MLKCVAQVGGFVDKLKEGSDNVRDQIDNAGDQIDRFCMAVSHFVHY